MIASMIAYPLICWPVLVAISAILSYLSWRLIKSDITREEQRVRDLAPLSDEWREQAS